MPKPTPQNRMESELPYGLWTAPDGREVLFNRGYEPIWQRRPGEAPEAADRSEEPTTRAMAWFYLTEAPPWLDAESRTRCEAILTAWGVPLPDLGPPRRRQGCKPSRTASRIEQWPATAAAISAATRAARAA